MRPRAAFALSSVVGLAGLVVASNAGAQATVTATATANPELAAAGTPKADVKTDGPHSAWHPKYAAEIEPHFVVAGLDKYSAGLGFGANVTIPIWEHAPFKGIDDTIAFGIGADWVRYAAYRPRDPRDPKILTYAWYLPVFIQWNLWLGARASLFLEPTIVYRFASYQDNCGGLPCVDTTRVLPSGSIGLRFRIVDHASVTVRVGWPMISLGGSWL
jgi:hypothetical protein